MSFCDAAHFGELFLKLLIFQVIYIFDCSPQSVSVQEIIFFASPFARASDAHLGECSRWCVYSACDIQVYYLHIVEQIDFRCKSLTLSYAAFVLRVRLKTRNEGMRSSTYNVYIWVFTAGRVFFLSRVFVEIKSRAQLQPNVGSLEHLMLELRRQVVLCDPRFLHTV